MSSNKGNCDLEHKHKCAVRYLCALRHKKGLNWFREYISKSPNIHHLLNDFIDQYAKGNRGTKWK